MHLATFQNIHGCAHCREQSHCWPVQCEVGWVARDMITIASQNCGQGSFRGGFLTFGCDAASEAFLESKKWTKVATQ